MAHIQLVKQTSSDYFSGDAGELRFLHQIKIGEWIHADFKRVRNYAFHKRFSNSCNWDSITGLRSVGRSRLANESWFQDSLITYVNQ